MDLYAYIFIGLFVGFVALSLKFAFERDEKPHLPDCPGTFTPEQIARKGGKEAQRLGTARRWTPEEAREAGRKGGSVSRKRGPNRVKRAKQSA